MYEGIPPVWKIGRNFEDGKMCRSPPPPPPPPPPIIIIVIGSYIFAWCVSSMSELHGTCFELILCTWKAINCIVFFIIWEMCFKTAWCKDSFSFTPCLIYHVDDNSSLHSLHTQNEDVYTELQKVINIYFDFSFLFFLPFLQKSSIIRA